MRTNQEFRKFLLDNYEMFAALGWAGYSPRLKRGCVCVTITVRQNEPYIEVTYVHKRDLLKETLPEVTQRYLQEKIALYDPEKSIVVCVKDMITDALWVNRIERPDITPPEAYRKHRVDTDKYVDAYNLGRSPAPGTKLNQ